MRQSSVPGIVIGLRELPQFLCQVLPRLEEIAAVEGATALRERFWIAPPERAQVQLSRWGKGLAARFAFYYGSRKIDPLQPEVQAQGRVLVRDVRTERPLLQVLEGSDSFLTAGSTCWRRKRQFSIFCGTARSNCRRSPRSTARIRRNRGTCAGLPESRRA